MATIEQLKEIIVELRLELIRANIPQGHCPYAYYYGVEQEGDCDDCNECKRKFFEKYEMKIRQEVEKL